MKLSLAVGTMSGLPEIGLTPFGRSRSMVLAMVRSMGIGRFALPAALVCALAGCSALPDVSQVQAPRMDFSAFEIRDWNSYAKTQTTRAITPNDLVDPSGHCAGVAPPPPTGADPGLGASAPPPTRGVGLDMSECEVVAAIGAPQTVDIGANERGARNVILTYLGSDRAGTYHFVDGRLVSLERGPEPPPPPQAEKKPTKRQAKPKPAQQPTT